MAFLDNSGDIILDAVLTDTGRFRLARGDGSFKIVKYAFADDEIDYGKYNKDHLSGSAYYDLDVLKTPILEAFTNNTSNMKHKLLSIPRTNLLYLPIMQLNVSPSFGGKPRNQQASQAADQFVVLVDENTEDKILPPSAGDIDNTMTEGIIRGFEKQTGEKIVIDQGLNTTAISFKFALDPDLRETRYIVEIDNRLGVITNKDGQIKSPNFIDDDNIASYTFTANSAADMIDNLLNTENASSLSGPRGTRFEFSIAASIELNSSTFLFTKLGNTGTFVSGNNKLYGTEAGGGLGGTIYMIDTIVKVTLKIIHMDSFNLFLTIHI